MVEDAPGSVHEPGARGAARTTSATCGSAHLLGTVDRVGGTSWGTPGVRRRSLARVLASSLTIVVLASCGDAGRTEGARSTTSSGAPDEIIDDVRLSDLPAFADAPWADEMKAEQDGFDRMGKPDSKYGRYSLPDFEGRYTNVEDSERRTSRRSCDCPRKEAWVIGTSAAFGLGQRDDHTIASYLNRLGVESGWSLHVRNLGVPGVTMTDELDGVVAHLELDPVRPDVVVVYGGFNDVLAAYMHAIVNDGALLDPIEFDGPWIEEYLSYSPAPPLPDEQIEPVARHVAAEIATTRDAIASELSTRGVESAFFWQADAFVNATQMEGLALSLNATMAQLTTRSDLRRLLERTVELLGDDVVDLRSPVAELDDPVFADPAHMNERGARFVAEHILAEITPLLGHG